MVLFGLGDKVFTHGESSDTRAKASKEDKVQVYWVLFYLTNIINFINIR